MGVSPVDLQCLQPLLRGGLLPEDVRVEGAPRHLALHLDQLLVHSFLVETNIIESQVREEQGLLDILDLELLYVKILVSILIEPYLESVILLDSFLV